MVLYTNVIQSDESNIEIILTVIVLEIILLIFVVFKNDNEYWFLRDIS